MPGAGEHAAPRLPPSRRASSAAGGTVADTCAAHRESAGIIARQRRSPTLVAPRAHRSAADPESLLAPPTETIRLSTMGNSGPTADETEVPTLAAGTMLGKYSIVRLLGAGGMGAVYEATHSEIGKRVAIKVLSPADRRRARRARPLPARGAADLARPPPAHRRRHRHGQRRRPDVSGDGVPARRGSRAAARAARTDRLRGDGRHHAAGLLGGRGRARRPASRTAISSRRTSSWRPATRRVHPKVLDFGISKGSDVVGR